MNRSMWGHVGFASFLDNVADKGSDFRVEHDWTDLVTIVLGKKSL